jgi:hypothetical protein
MWMRARTKESEASERKESEGSKWKQMRAHESKWNREQTRHVKPRASESGRVPESVQVHGNALERELVVPAKESIVEGVILEGPN